MKYIMKSCQTIQLFISALQTTSVMLVFCFWISVCIQNRNTTIKDFQSITTFWSPSYLIDIICMQFNCYCALYAWIKSLQFVADKLPEQRLRKCKCWCGQYEQLVQKLLTKQAIQERKLQQLKTLNPHWHTIARNNDDFIQ